jgi:hypothetical protein
MAVEKKKKRCCIEVDTSYKYPTPSFTTFGGRSEIGDGNDGGSNISITATWAL